MRTISVVEVGAIWKLSDGSAYLMASAQSEPAGGNMFWSDADKEPITEENLTAGCCSGWYAEPAPSAPVVAVTHSYFEVTSRDRSLNWSTSNGPTPYFATAPAWSWDLSRLFALSEVYSPDLRFLAIAEIDNNWFYAVELGWWPEDTYANGLALAADGTLISFQRSLENESVRSVIFNPDGSFVDEFPVEDGSDLGGIDPTGNFLIYVDGDGRCDGETSTAIRASSVMAS